MKPLALALASAGLLSASNASAITTLLFEDFDDTNVAYTTSVPEFTDGSGDFFIRTDGSDHGSFVSYADVQGSYFAGMDLNGEGATLPLTMNFTGIDINGFSSLEFSSLIAEDDDGSNEDWDLSDFVHIDYRIDSGGYQNLLWFESIPDGDSFNAVPAVDTNFDGDGDGTQLTDAFSLFTAGIAGAGSLLDLRITFQLNAGDEDIAFDNISVTGTGSQAVVPLPAAAWLLGAGLVGYLGLGRGRRERLAVA
jgi:hypothetical protein